MKKLFKFIKDIIKAMMPIPDVPNSVVIVHEVELTEFSRMEIRGSAAWESYVKGRLMQGFIDKLEPYIVYSRKPLPEGAESFKLTLIVVDRNKVKGKLNGTS